MDKVGCGRGAAIAKKGKKKQAKDELDRVKQAEKKKRRLEKALAASAAMRSELEKKKQKKIEEQQRLDKEGAAIAESVALHVLLGEDTDESCPWDHSRNFRKYSSGGPGWAPGEWNGWGVGPVRNFRAPYYEETSQGADPSVGLSSLQIGEEPLAGARTVIFNMGNRVNLYKEY